MPDIADLNPVFAGKINDFLAAAKQAGIPAHIISGYRDNAKQSKLFANYRARQAGQPIPYPEEGSGGVAAPPGGSMHNFGLATDVLANNGHQQDLIAFANAHPEFGVKSLGAFDPPHFQLAGDQRTLMAHPPTAGADFKAPDLTAWLNGAAATPAMAGGAAIPATLAARGTTINTVPMDPSIVAHGGVPSPAQRPVSPAVASGAPSPSLMSNLQKGDVGAIFNQLATGKKGAQGNEQPGTSALSKLAGLTKGKEAPAQTPSAPMLQGMGDSTPAIAPAAQQLLSQTFANAAKPLSWSMLPYGSDAGPQGLTLNSGAQNV